MNFQIGPDEGDDAQNGLRYIHVYTHE